MAPKSVGYQNRDNVAIRNCWMFDGFRSSTMKALTTTRFLEGDGCHTIISFSFFMENHNNGEWNHIILFNFSEIRSRAQRGRETHAWQTKSFHNLCAHRNLLCIVLLSFAKWKLSSRWLCCSRKSSKDLWCLGSDQTRQTMNGAENASAIHWSLLAVKKLRIRRNRMCRNKRLANEAMN